MKVWGVGIMNDGLWITDHTRLNLFGKLRLTPEPIRRTALTCEFASLQILRRLLCK